MEINKKWDLMLELDEKISMIVDILSKQKQEKNDSDSDVTILKEFLYPPRYQQHVLHLEATMQYR